MFPQGRKEDSLDYLSPSGYHDHGFGKAAVSVSGVDLARFPTEGRFFMVARFCDHRCCTQLEGVRSGGGQYATAILRGYLI
jgi:hypothetical protein